jgi:hypothetical protein
MDDNQWLADRFEEHRAHLRAVAYRMLGSLTAADDAVQDAWLRLSRSGAGEVDNLGGWLTTPGARRPAASLMIRGAAAVARQAQSGLAATLRAANLHPALVNGAAGGVVTVHGRPITVMGFTVADGKIAEIDAIADPERVCRIAAAALHDQWPHGQPEAPGPSPPRQPASDQVNAVSGDKKDEKPQVSRRMRVRFRRYRGEP